MFMAFYMENILKVRDSYKRVLSPMNFILKFP